MYAFLVESDIIFCINVMLPESIRWIVIEASEVQMVIGIERFLVSLATIMSG
jgi:hypothetical protein